MRRPPGMKVRRASAIKFSGCDMPQALQAKPLEVLVFEIEGRRYGLAAVVVRELLRMVAVVPLPGAPAVVEGVVNLRGAIVPVLDLRQRFGLPARPATPADHLIVAEADGRPVALRVDRAVELLPLAAAEVED